MVHCVHEYSINNGLSILCISKPFGRYSTLYCHISRS